jgi:hypothetical protein
LYLDFCDDLHLKVGKIYILFILIEIYMIPIDL